MIRYKTSVFLLAALLFSGCSLAPQTDEVPVVDSIPDDSVQSDTSDTIDNLGFTLPEDFKISLFAEDIPGARVIVQDSLGNFWVSQTGKGEISTLEMEGGKIK